MNESNKMQPKLLPLKHFESVQFHSLSPFDFRLRLNKRDLIALLKDLGEHKDDIALMKPTDNDQLYQLLECKDLDIKTKKPLVAAVKTYEEKFDLKIPTRMLVNSTNHRLQKCKDCESVTTDDFNKLEGLPVVESYDPEDKESLMSTYCDVLRKIKPLDPNKSLIEQIKFNKGNKKQAKATDKEDVNSKIDEFTDQFNRETQLEVVKKMKSNKDAEEELDAEDQQKEAERKILQEILLRAEEKINERIEHKEITRALKGRLEKLNDYMSTMIDRIEQEEINKLQLQLLNTQLGLGNNEMRRLQKNSDRVQ